MPRFVILEHDWPVRHWDLMLETGPVLRTWRLAAPPESGMSVAAEPSFDHRLAYLDYEGPISGDRGTVNRWKAGMYQVFAELPDRVEIICDCAGERFRLTIKRSDDGLVQCRCDACNLT